MKLWSRIQKLVGLVTEGGSKMTRPNFVRKTLQSLEKQKSFRRKKLIIWCIIMVLSYPFAVLNIMNGLDISGIISLILFLNCFLICIKEITAYKESPFKVNSMCRYTNEKSFLEHRIKYDDLTYYFQNALNTMESWNEGEKR